MKGELKSWHPGNSSSFYHVIGMDPDITIRNNSFRNGYGLLNSNYMYEATDTDYYTALSEGEFMMGDLAPNFETSSWSIYSEYQFPEFLYGGIPGSFFPLHLNHEGVNYRSHLYLNDQGLHPGCTIPVTMDLQTFEVYEREEPVEIIKLPIPSERQIEVTINSYEKSLVLTPFYNRAPVLCSDYKVDLDQIFSMVNSDYQPFISPKLSTIYNRSINSQPLNGVYDVEKNKYTPNEGFKGFDTFEVLIDDKTGDFQIVTIDVNVY